MAYVTGEMREMEEKEESRVLANGAINGYWFWGGATAAQLGWGVAIFKRGYAGHNNLMPLTAFAVASLFIGAFATGAVAGLQLSGIRSLEDLKTINANIKNARKSTKQ